MIRIHRTFLTNYFMAQVQVVLLSCTMMFFGSLTDAAMTFFVLGSLNIGIALYLAGRVWWILDNTEEGNG